MANISKQTSARIAKIAAQTMHDSSASKTARSLAGSVVSQRNTSHQTGAGMEEVASSVMRSKKYSAPTKELAGSVLSQANKGR